MNDVFQKIKVYWTATPTYWKLTSDSQELKHPIGHYPLSFRDRLTQGHYIHFDKNGMPMFHSKAGNLVYFCTGLCSFAFAHWEEYLLTENELHAKKVLQVANKLMDIAITQKNGALMIYDYDDDDGANPISCAMNQGEAISVFCRAFAYSGNQNYLNSAEALSLPFKEKYGSNGVIGELSGETVWFLEGGQYILNGHIYALFGLVELQKISSLDWLEALVQEGIDSVIKALESFDNGFWSWYWLESPKYIASAMYHNLHICQLAALGKITNEQQFFNYSKKFSLYAKHPKNRLRAGLVLVMAKLRMKILRK